MDFFDDYLSAQASLLNSTGPPLDNSYEEFVLELADVVDLLCQVIDDDTNSPTEVAYDTGSDHFNLPDQPFPFWDDPSWDDIAEWIEFEFPVLAVGSPSIYTSYPGTGLNDLYVMLQSATDPEAWLEFLEWLVEHYDDGDEINGARAGDFDALCIYCCPERTLNERAAAQDWLINERGYTQEQLDEFCENFYDEGWCDDPNQSNREKAFPPRRLNPDTLLDDLQRVLDAIEDYINPEYQADFAVVQAYGSP
jgi:hypothetical protein